MTMEKLDDNYHDFDSKLAWLLKRMRKFHTEARRQAVLADNLWSQFCDVSLTRRGGIKDRYDAAVESQIMYDRWAMRESSIILAEIAAQEYRNTVRYNGAYDPFDVSDLPDTAHRIAS